MIEDLKEAVKLLESCNKGKLAIIIAMLDRNPVLILRLDELSDIIANYTEKGLKAKLEQLKQYEKRRELEAEDEE